MPSSCPLQFKLPAETDVAVHDNLCIVRTWSSALLESTMSQILGKCMANGDLLCRTPGALSVNAVKVGASGSLAGGLITGVSNLSATSTDSARLLKAGVSEFNSDGTPKASMTPRASSYMVPPESPRVERSTDSQNRQSLLGVQSMSVEASGGSLLSPGTSKKVNILRQLLHVLCELEWITCGCLLLLPEVG